MAWATLTEARNLWRSAPADDSVLTLYLEAVKPAIIDYAPTVTIETATDGWIENPVGSGLYEWGNADDAIPDMYIPEHWKLAQVLQARNLFNAGLAGPANGDFDGSSFGVATYPLDWSVKQLLRPIRGLGAIA